MRNFLECEHFSGTNWTLYLQLIAVEMVIAFECLDDEVIDREPNRAAPVGVAAEEVAGAFAGHVIHAMFLMPGDENVGLVAVDARDRAQSVGRKKFILIEHVAQGMHEPGGSAQRACGGRNASTATAVLTASNAATVALVVIIVSSLLDLVLPGKPVFYRVRVARNSPSRIHVLPSVSKASPSQRNESGVISVKVQRVGVPLGRVPI